MSDFVVLVLGGGGYLAQFLLSDLSLLPSLSLHFSFRSPVSAVPPSATGHPLDLTDTAAVRQLLADLRPHVVVNCAAMTALKACEASPSAASAVNAPTALFAAAAAIDALVIQLSTDQVYDGCAAPYDEAAVCAPRNVYGASKLRCEEVFREAGGRGVVLRSSNILGPRAPFSEGGKFLQWLDDTLARLSAEGEKEVGGEAGKEASESLSLWADEHRNFIWVRDICRVVRLAVEQARAVAESELAPASGVHVFNMGGPERLSRVDVGTIVCGVKGYDAGVIEAGYRYDAEGNDTGAGPKNPQDIGMTSEKLLRACGWESFTRIEDGLAEEQAASS